MSAPAGWYPDPAGSPRRRYWDGARWTEHLEQAASPAQLRAPEGTNPNTVWIWLVVLLPLVPLAGLLLVDWRGMIDDILANPDDPFAGYRALGPGYAIMLALGVITNALAIVFGWLDWRELVRRGVPQPFHWAWGFTALVGTSAVYPIGRAVVARRRTGRGIAPMWATIAVLVVSFAVGVGFTVWLVSDIMTAVLRSPVAGGIGGA